MLAGTQCELELMVWVLGLVQLQRKAYVRDWHRLLLDGLVVLLPPSTLHTHFGFPRNAEQLMTVLRDKGSILSLCLVILSSGSDPGKDAVLGFLGFLGFLGSAPYQPLSAPQPGPFCVGVTCWSLTEISLISIW